MILTAFLNGFFPSSIKDQEQNVGQEFLLAEACIIEAFSLKI
jgi:hypothetical protein